MAIVAGTVSTTQTATIGNRLKYEGTPRHDAKFWLLEKYRPPRSAAMSDSAT